jgi:hypothetical protein
MKHFSISNQLSRLIIATAVMLLFFSTGKLAYSKSWTPGEADNIIYRESFSTLGNPAQYLRIARAAEDWEIVEADGERWLRVYFEPSSERIGLVVWDLVQTHFKNISIQVRPQAEGIGRVFLQANLFDREGSTYSFHPFGNQAVQRQPLKAGEWNDYSRSIPADLATIFMRGAEVAPFLHGRGDQVEAWDSIDFTNRGYRTLHFNIEFAANSPAIGKRVYVDFKALTLRAGSFP